MLSDCTVDTECAVKLYQKVPSRKECGTCIYLKGNPIPIVIPKTEWICKSCEDTECRFSVNQKLQNLEPVGCNLDCGYARWERVK